MRQIGRFRSPGPVPPMPPYRDMALVPLLDCERFVAARERPGS
jgi:hypothetical protein